MLMTLKRRLDWCNSLSHWTTATHQHYARARVGVISVTGHWPDTRQLWLLYDIVRTRPGGGGRGFSRHGESGYLSNRIEPQFRYNKTITHVPSFPTLSMSDITVVCTLAKLTGCESLRCTAFYDPNILMSHLFTGQSRSRGSRVNSTGYMTVILKWYMA